MDTNEYSYYTDYLHIILIVN